MLPLAERFVARRIVDLEHGLRPAAAHLVGRVQPPPISPLAGEDVEVVVPSLLVSR